MQSLFMYIEKLREELGKTINIEYGNIEKKKVTSNRC